jgi:ABC-type lipoprotein release transport system permease subunit
MAMPGILAGAIACLFFGNPLLSILIGALGGTLLGVVVELWPLPSFFEVPQDMQHQMELRSETSKVARLKLDCPKKRLENKEARAT